MDHGKHSYVVVGLVALGALLFLTGNAGGLLFLLWPLACLAMMVWMMWGTGRSTPGPADHRRDDLTRTP